MAQKPKGIDLWINIEKEAVASEGEVAEFFAKGYSDVLRVFPAPDSNANLRMVTLTRKGRSPLAQGDKPRGAIHYRIRDYVVGQGNTLVATGSREREITPKEMQELQRNYARFMKSSRTP